MNVRLEDAEMFTGLLAGTGAEWVYAGVTRAEGGFEDHLLGERALVVAFVDWAARHGQISGVPHLLETDSRFDPGAVLRLHRSVERLRRLALDPADRGIALSTRAHPRTPMRGLVAFSPATVLKSASAAVTIGEDGLLLTTRSVAPTAGGPLVDAADRWLLNGWGLNGDGVTLETTEGAVQLESAGVAGLLRSLGRGCDEVAVTWLPVATIFTPLMVFLDDALRQAMHMHADVVVRCGEQERT